MKRNALMLAVLIGSVALYGCNRDGTDDTVADASPEPAATSTEAASQTPEPMPQTQPAATTQTPPPGGPAGTVAAGTLMASTGTAADATYVTDSAGAALYMLEGDKDGSKCTAACLQAWPPLLAADAQPAAGANLDGGMVATLQRADGATQVTYNGHPLHRYAADTGAGRTAGHGVKDQWGTWYLVTPQGGQLAVAK